MHLTAKCAEIAEDFETIATDIDKALCIPRTLWLKMHLTLCAPLRSLRLKKCMPTSYQRLPITAVY